MKIYFDGCSWTKGEELENQEEERYSRLICNKLGAEETNLGIGGGSNDRIIRNLIVENNIEEYDHAVIQMTLPARTEYWDGNSKWIKINPCFNFSNWLFQKEGRIDNLSNKFRHHSDFWTYYYKMIFNVYYSHVKEKIQYETIKSYCKSKGVPLTICSINEWTKLDFDYIMKMKRRHRAKMGHPNKMGHQIIAKTILDNI